MTEVDLEQTIALLNSGQGKAALGGLKSLILPAMMLLAEGEEREQAMLGRSGVE